MATGALVFMLSIYVCVTTVHEFLFEFQKISAQKFVKLYYVATTTYIKIHTVSDLHFSHMVNSLCNYYHQSFQSVILEARSLS